MKTIFIPFTGVLLIFILLFPVTFLQAAETTFELQKQIKSDIAKIGKSNKSRNEKTKELDKEIKGLAAKITSTTDEDEKKEMRNAYFKKRSMKLKAMAEWSVEIEPALLRVSKNMSLLEKEMNRAMPGDKKKGLSPSDREPIKGTLRGAGNMLSLLQKLNVDDRRVNNLTRMLVNLDKGYRKHFLHGGNVDLRKQIVFVEELHAYVHSVKLLLMQEANYQEVNVYILMEDEMVETVNEFQEQFHAPDFRGFEEEHETDEMILGKRNEMGNKDYRNTPDLNNIGNW